ncbi:MAG: hypothetical protein WD491_05585 [Balneolales bacterium]
MLNSALPRCTAVLLTILFLSILQADSVFAQRSFGITYTPPDNADRFHSDLNYLKQAGIRSVMLEEVIESGKMAAIEDSGLDVYVSIPVEFPTIWTLQQERDELVSTWSRYIEFYREYENVQGIGLFRFGQTHSQRFRNFFELLIDEIGQITDIPLFYISSRPEDYDFTGLFDYRMYQAADTSSISRLPSFHSIGGIAYSTPDMSFNIRMFQSILSQTRNISHLPIFLEWEWFVQNRSADGLIEEVVSSYANDANALFANPRAIPEKTSSNWLILILLIIWASFVIHYSLMPTYRKTLVRFFDNHKFMMNDVMERHTRVGQSSIVVLFQQGFLGGLLLLALTRYTLSPLGFESLIYHLPVVLPYIPNFLVIFIIGFLISIMINSLCILWLYLSNSDIHHFSQAAAFQLWPQHLNLIVVTLLIAFIMAKSSIIIINITALMFLILIAGNFLFSVFDAGSHTFTRFYYYPVTAGVYSILLLGLIIWVYYITGFVEYWDLATSL